MAADRKREAGMPEGRRSREMAAVIMAIRATMEESEGKAGLVGAQHVKEAYQRHMKGFAAEALAQLRK